ncbi:hypothetical protein PsYK624_165780 [Phanerochaete sordida]|uniref:Uncharacterized protein n=1 Tax=Phanerochaete sordida TaxID=48140 RepID=A0A9P3GR35_9APHY|nr:hypothetical protein PsYK624_165780 [Phanerochaete sordida]
MTSSYPTLVGDIHQYPPAPLSSSPFRGAHAARGVNQRPTLPVPGTADRPVDVGEVVTVTDSTCGCSCIIA